MTPVHPTAALPASTRTYTRDQLTSLWQRARDKARATHTHAWRSGSSWLVTSAERRAPYRVVVHGTDPFASSCGCRAGEFGAPCHHRATVAEARIAHVESITMGPVWSVEGAHCLGCQRWHAVIHGTGLYCPDCR